MTGDPQPRAQPSWRILEIGRSPLFKSCLPEQTRWLRTGVSLANGDERCESETGYRSLLDALWRLRRGRYDLAVLPAVEIAYRADAGVAKRLVRRLLSSVASWPISAPLLEFALRLSRTPLVFIDFSDSPVLSYEVCRLAPTFSCYFKRELFPEITLRQGDAADLVANAKVRPFSLFVPKTDPPIAPADKTADLFFSGSLHTELRREGFEAVRRLEKKGLRVDLPTGRLEYDEYLKRMSTAWLVWSPAGFGWDCYRHYEACFAGAVPIINRPAAAREMPLEPGKHCLLYDPTVRGDLERTVIAALAGQDRLRAMAAQAQNYVAARYSRAGLVDYMKGQIVGQLTADGSGGKMPIDSH